MFLPPTVSNLDAHPLFIKMVCVHTHARACMRMHGYTHIHTHTHKQTHTLSKKKNDNKNNNKKLKPIITIWLIFHILTPLPGGSRFSWLLFVCQAGETCNHSEHERIAIRSIGGEVHLGDPP